LKTGYVFAKQAWIVPSRLTSRNKYLHSMAYEEREKGQLPPQVARYAWAIRWTRIIAMQSFHVDDCILVA